MKTLSLIAGAACAIALLGLAASTGAQQQQQNQQQPQNARQQAEADYSQALRELNIMSNIFAATMQEENRGGRNFGPTPDPDALYLAGQGMVFTFNVNNPWFRGGVGTYWQDFGESMAQLAQELTNELSAAFPDADFDFDFDYDGAIPVPPAPPGVYVGPNPNDFLQAQREAIREMSEAMREKQRDIQELQRDLRELQRDLRDPDENVSRIETQMAEVEAEMEQELAALERQRAAYEQYRAEYEQLRVDQVESYGRELANRAVSALCDYGATLRSLPANEHVTLIFENFSEDRDQVYVFEYGDVASCTSSDQLMASAVSYQL